MKFKRYGTKVKMIKFLFLLSVLFFRSVPVQAQPQAGVSPADPDKPLPKAAVTLSLPGSPRTKKNLKDVALDFLLTRALNRLSNIKVTYGFLEIQEQTTVKLSDVSVALDTRNVQGTVLIKTLIVDPKELLTGLNKKRLQLNEIKIEGLKTDMLLLGSGKEVSLTSDTALINGAKLIDWDKNEKSAFSFDTISFGKGAFVRDGKKLAWKSYIVKGLEIVVLPTASASVKQIVFNGKTFDSAKDFHKEVWEPVLFK